MRYYKYNNNGFTLIELLVIISIIGFVSAGAFYMIDSGRKVARDTKRVADLQVIRRAIDIYRNDYGAYPAPTINSLGECVGDTGNITKCGNQTNQFEIVMKNYLNYIPADPRHNENCGIGGGSPSNCDNINNNHYFYSYDPAHMCPDRTCCNCAVLCFNRAESKKYTCAKNNPVCGSNQGPNMGQKYADYCIIFDKRQK